MVKYTDSCIMNNMIENSFEYYNNLEEKYKTPDPLNYLNNQFHMNYYFNQILLKNDYDKNLFIYINHLINTYPLGFGEEFMNHIKDENNNKKESILSIYYDFRMSERNYNNN